jgi:hypothetical protein
MNVKPTVELIRESTIRMRQYANELERLAKNMEDGNDLSLASEALSIISNCFSNIRLDLFVTRPLREYERTANAKLPQTD